MELSIIFDADINDCLHNFFRSIINLNNSDPKIYIGETYSHNIDFNKWKIQLSKNDMDYIKNMSNMAFTKLLNLDDLLKNKNVMLNNVWKISVINNIFFDFPFTLDDIIFIPYLLINTNQKDFIKTLIHERIHVYQRYNFKNYDEYISLNYDWINIGNKYNIKSNVSISNNLEIVYNPDTLYLSNIYLLKYNDKYYWSTMFINIMTDQKISHRWFYVEFIKNNIFIYPATILYKYDHPFEEMAYKLSEEL